MDLGTRLKQIRKDTGQTQEVFSKELGVTSSAYKKYETNRVVPLDAFFKLVCLKFSINENWLRTGEGDMYKSLHNTNTLQGLVGQVSEDIVEERGKHTEFREWLAIKALKLPDDHLDVLKEILINFSDDNLKLLDQKKNLPQ